MKTLMSRKLMMAILSLTVLLAACEGPVGPVGPAGTPGAEGTAGANGANGTNGVGFDQLVANGNIMVTYSGNRPDGVPFDKQLNYPFSDAGYTYSTVHIDRHEAYELYKFQMTRWYSAPDNDLYGYPDIQNRVTLSVEIEEGDVELKDPPATFFKVNTNIIDGRKFFNLVGENEKLTEDVISEYTYNAETGALSFVMDMILPAGSNSTGFDINVHAVANVIVYEGIQETPLPPTP